jgi:peroxiredoxin (alkyl hydroperoxide reductase subunit C)
MLKIGDKAPQFEEMAYWNGDFKKIKLSDFNGKWVVLFFYPLDFTFICPTEIEGFAKNYKEFEKLGAVIIGASTDSQYTHKAWFETDQRLKGTPYPIIADTAHRVSRSYGVLVEELGVATRGTFIIDQKGVIRWMNISDLSVGRSVRETLRALQAFQTGELCPVEWTPGAKTLGKA